MLSYFTRAYQAWIDYPLAEGRRLGQYEIVRFLGEGSYGLTYLCRNLRRGGEVVVKQARRSKKRLSEELLRQEGELLRRLQHPRVPACLETFEEKGRRFLVTEYIRGETVEDLIFHEEREFTEEVSLRFIRELMEIVRFVHGEGYVHLDVRIPNVMVQEGGVHLIDFGLARRIGDWAGIDPFPDEETRLRRTPQVQSDHYAVGHFLLFLLYSAYRPSPGQEPAGWQEELALTAGTRSLIRRLLQEEPPYADTESFVSALDMLLQRPGAADGLPPDSKAAD